MENGSNSRELKSVIGHHQGTFDRWLASSAIIGSLFATAIVAMALAGSFSKRQPLQARHIVSRALTAFAHLALVSRILGPQDPQRKVCDC
jgi:hypothetical protein